MNTVTYAKFTGPNGIFDRFDRDRNGLDENELRAASRDASVYTDKDLSASLLGQESAKNIRLAITSTTVIAMVG